MEPKMAKKSAYKESEQNQWTGAKPVLTEHQSPAEEVSSERTSMSPRDIEETMTTPDGKEQVKSRKCQESTVQP
jgi:hypothetical protein